MSRRLLFLVSILVAGAMVSTAALAFNLLNPPRRWFPDDLVKNVIVDEGGLSSVTDGDGGVTAALGAVTEWNTAGGNTLNILSSSSGPPTVAVGDNQSHLVFDDPFKICRGMCLAATTVGFFDGDETGICDGLTVVRITDSDIFFNTSHKKITFTTEAEDGASGPNSTCSGEFYLEEIVTHEVGHLIGLDHSEDSDVMAPSVGFCENRTLNADDTASRDKLYDCTFAGGPVCGDTTCDALEDQCTCAVDCGAPPSTETSCDDGVDNDCDGLIDGGDTDCSICTLGQKGDLCDGDAECCSNKCRGRPNGKTCK